ncbi:unnamed protein product [Adineta ricciae]|uniref:Peptidase C51 domain-containing protein n=1 Tax=Adineta ricciae TaxID=249248 RepID=A0A815RM67_ADIRI|nr:unnamed protein product [Adineta ricciae]CAF1479627.1 unnamed protein product [Adineta ricciae]
MDDSELVRAPFNHVLGTAFTNVPAFSNTDDGVFHIERHYMHGVFLGVKWQCVEYARRWLLLKKSCVFKSVRFAADIWTQLKYVERVTDEKQFRLIPHANGSPTKPQVDSFLIYSISEEQPVGHIAVICDVGPDYIRIAEQNVKFHYWNGEYAREIRMVEKDGLYYLEDEDPMHGWMEIEDENNELKPLDESVINMIHPRYQERLPIGKIQRCAIPEKSDVTRDGWLNKDNPPEEFFIEHFLDNFQRVNISSNHLVYYKINVDFLLATAETSNELHQMFLEATKRVIDDDALLTRFGIPKRLWNRLRRSWNDEQHLTMTGRLDLVFNGEQTKVLEYHADNTTALFESAIIQKKWAEIGELPSSFTSGRRLHQILVNNWKIMDITAPIHLLINDNQEEMLTALYMQSVLKEANVSSKLFIGTDQLFWKDDRIVDKDGELVQVVWKLWVWDTVLRDEQSAEHQDDEHPRISDILLHEQIKIIEPFWKIITKNRALLSVLWEMYPNHSHLLRAEWNLTDETKEILFVNKPMYGSDGDGIYQERFALNNYDGHQPVISSWIIREKFGGFVVREAENSNANENSCVIPCCIVWEEEK